MTLDELRLASLSQLEEVPVTPDFSLEDTKDPQTMDDLLDMDLQSLSQVSILQPTITDPVVEGVSKTLERASEAAGIVQVITATDIEQFGAKNLFEVLQRGTSVFMTGSFLFPRNVASIRGNLQNHEDNHVLLLINGRPFRDTTFGGVNLSLYTAFPIQTISRIEIIRGPGSVLYGTNAFNGVINIVTKDPDQPTSYASVLSGSYGWQSYSLAGGNGNEERGAYAGATYSRQKGWPFSATEDVVAPPPLDTQTAPWGEDNVGVFSMYRSGNFTANVFAARATEETLGPIGDWPSGRLKDPRVFCDLGYRADLDDWRTVDVHFTYNYDGTEFPSAISAAIPYFGPSHSFLLEGTYYSSVTDELDLMAGGWVDFHFGDAAMGPIQAIPPYTEIWYGIYMQLTYQASDWLKLVGGMQANLPGEIKSGIVPRFGAIASLTDNWTAKFLYGQAFRSPYQTERSINVPGILLGNAGLFPETIQTFDAQLAYHTDKFRLAATYFHSDYFDIITRTSSAPQTYFNGGSMTFDGVELENEWEITEFWRCLGSMTYQNNKRDGVNNTTSVPNWMAKLGLVYNNNGLVIGLFDSYFGDQFVPVSATPLNADPQAYHLVSLNTTYELSKRLQWDSDTSLRLQFLIENLFDEDINHVEFERELINSFPAGPGITYYGGLTLDY